MEREPTSSRTARAMPTQRAILTALAFITAILIGRATLQARDGSNGQPPPSPGQDQEEHQGLQGPELSEPYRLPFPAQGMQAPEEGAPTPMDKYRLRIALCSVALLAFVVVAAFASLWEGQAIENLTRLMEIVFAPLVAVVTAVVAFYFTAAPPTSDFSRGTRWRRYP